VGLTGLQPSYLACPSMALKPPMLNQRLLALLLVVVRGGDAAVPVFTSRAALKTAVSACIKKSPDGCCLQQQRVLIG
jgi:hypothetical protein